jgi:tRNA G18 (ribose-2'-O)-methylase SpoU
MSGVPVERVDDIRDPRLADYRLPRDAPNRQRGIFIAEGHLAVSQLLMSPRHATRSVLTTAAALKGLHAALDATPSVRVLVTSHEAIRRVVGFRFHRGCLAVGERGIPLEPAALIDPPGPRALLVLEGLVDPENIGAAFRNALAFGADGVLLTPGCGDPLGRKAIRASAGGALRIPFATLHDWPAAIVALRGAGYDLLALTPSGTTELTELGRARPLAARLGVLVGNEGAGLTEAARREATLTVRIAMAPGVDSLNAAATCAIALHHLAHCAGSRRTRPTLR